MVLQQLPVCRRHVVAALIGMDQVPMVAAMPSRLPVGQNPRWFLAFNPRLIRPMIIFSGFLSLYFSARIEVLEWSHCREGYVKNTRICLSI